jgi:hypothetical protein
MSKMFRTDKRAALRLALAAFCLLTLAGCGQSDDGGNAEAPKPDVPRGYVSVLQIEKGDRLLGFGPFVGYYFRPESTDDLSRVHLVCFNERSFYTKDVAENAKLFEGEARLVELADLNTPLPDSDRINPVYFSDAPPQWLENRPEPKDEFLHFHSCYDAEGPVLAGYWIRHEAMATFTYDMGGRVGPDSPLYHQVEPGVDKEFARIVEFDRGPDRSRK